jgi:acetyl-CoA C-acetyltransferase
VSEPYTKLLTANIQVDQAAAVILSSAEAARDAGVPLERWVFPVASSFAQDEWYFSERDELAASPAISAAGQAVLEHAGVCIGEVDDIDLYSCFPSAVQIAAHELGLPLDDPARPLTVTGGLTFSGGPGNNYSLHAIATLVGRLRDQPDQVGLSSALGWYCTKHSFGLYSGTPPPRPFAEIDANDRITRTSARAATAEYQGPATIDAYTVPYDRNGAPEAVIASAVVPDSTRALVRTSDPDSIEAVLETDPLGQTVEISPGTLKLSRS